MLINWKLYGVAVGVLALTGGVVYVQKTAVGSPSPVATTTVTTATVTPSPSSPSSVTTTNADAQKVTLTNNQKAIDTASNDLLNQALQDTPDPEDTPTTLSAASQTDAIDQSANLVENVK